MKPSDFFRELADKIDRNAEADFAGAFLILPPTFNGAAPEPVSGLLVGAPDMAAFLGLVKTKLDVTVISYDDMQKQQQQGFRR